jgi:DNA-binding phage protein
MGRLRSGLRKLEEQVGLHYEELLLPDGTRVRYTPEDIQGALDAAIRGDKEHWLLPLIRQVETTRGMPGLIRSLEASREKAEDPT